MVTVEFLGPIKKDALEVEISDLKELSNLLKKDQQLSPWLKSSAVAVNDKIIKNSSYKLENGDKITLLPPVCGG